MTTPQLVLSILVMAVVTFATRAIPFLLFDNGGEPPKLVVYLGKVLPPAIIAMLIIYCLREVSLLNAPYGIPQLVSVLAVIVLHLWKRNNLLSIFGGTVLYMVLIQNVF